MKSFILPISLIILLVFIGVFLWQRPMHWSEERGEQATSSTSLSLGGPFTLTDQHGAARSDTEFNGKYRLVYFGYTHCPDVCPQDIMALSQTLEALGKDSEKLVALFISVDPERDTVARLSEYATAFHPSLIMLTGDKAAIDGAKKAYKVYAARAQAQETSLEYLVDHSSFIYLMDKEGDFIRHFPHGTGPDVLKDALVRLMAQDAKRQ